ncbi:MAG: hypothetical protein N4A47_04765 [Clostridia bacterium]|jgi:carbon starvation protein CstA|nr:hypothetical protein [Clostridia bacterium]
MMKNKKYCVFVSMLAVLGIWVGFNTLSFENFNLESILGIANMLLIIITLVFSISSKKPLENNFTRFFVVFTIGVNLFFEIYISVLKEIELNKLLLIYLVVISVYYTYLIKQKKSS